MTADQMSIYYRPLDYTKRGPQIYGRLNANAGILNGIFQYGRRSHLAFYVEEEMHFNHVEQQLLSRSPLKPKILNPIYHGDVLSLNKYDLYFSTDPQLSRSAFARSMIGTKAYSLCGLTHSFSSLSLVEEIGKMILAPLAPWDALICTSYAVKSVVQEIFKQWYDYLSHSRQMTYRSSLQLPVVPLGIHVNEVSRIQEKSLLRKNFREKWQIEDNDFVVLFHGRLSYYEKAHPVPMFLALEQSAKRIQDGGAIYCVQAGWFQNKEDLDHYKEAMKIFSPSIRPLFLLDITDDEKIEMWSGADVFVSLVDNIQEAFGLTPLEAMANGLPVVVSDWDGYKDTVRHGIDGFRIPSLLPPSGCGSDLALGYLTGAINYHTYCGLNAQMTAIDIDYCAEVLCQLYSSKTLRHQMGRSGRQHVIDHFDWGQIIKHYDELWDSLTERRRHGEAENNHSILTAPMLADPFLTYSAYPTQALGASDLVSLNEHFDERLNHIETNYLTRFGWQQRPNPLLLRALLDLIDQNGPSTVAQIVSHILKIDGSVSSGVIVRGLVYLIKYGVLRIEWPKKNSA